MASIPGRSKAVLSTLIPKAIKEIGQGSSDGPLRFITFAMLRSDEDRFNYMKSQLRNLDDIFPDVRQSAKKCSSKAEKLRTEGNKAFGLSQYEKAWELFTQSALYARPDHVESDGKNTLALAIANRSGALFFMGKYIEALVDIENALQIGYPEDLKYKLYDRKGKSYLALKSYMAAVTAFELAAALIDKAELSKIKRKSALKQIQKNIEVCIRNRGANIEVNIEEPKAVLPVLSDKPHATHPSLSSACDVEYIPGKGRGIVAARDIKPGEVLLVEKAFASVFIPNKEYKDCCHHCFNPCETLLPCLKCSTAMFCSSDCRYLAWETYHKYECGFPLDDLLESSWHLALRIVLVAGLDYLVEFQQKRNPDREDKIPKKFKGCNEEGQYLSSDYTSVYHRDISEDITVDMYIALSVISVFIVRLLEKMGFFGRAERQKKQTAMTCVGTCLIRQLVGQYPHIWHALPQGQEPVVTKIVGTAHPSTYSLLNHSCNIETSQVWHGNTVVLHSLQGFKQGQEVTMSYGKSFFNFSKEIRQCFMKEEFMFECSCEPCAKNWPVLHNISRIPMFKCTQCQDQLPRPEMDFFQCQRCNMIQSVKGKVESLRTSTELFEMAQEADDDQLRLQYIEAIDNLLVQPWMDSVECKAELTLSLLRKGSCVALRYVE